MPQVPEKLNDFRIYKDGNNKAGIADIKLPSFDPIVEAVRGAGILGEYESANIGHFQSMKLAINWRMLTVDFASLMEPREAMYDCRGANQVLNSVTGEYEFSSVRVLVKGAPTKNDPGKMEKGASYEGSTEIEATYIKVEIDGAVLVELDKINYKYVVNGKDYMADVRKALGL